MSAAVKSPQVSTAQTTVPLSATVNPSKATLQQQQQISAILGPSTDPLDADDFNAVDYINSIFPNEQSYAQAEAVQRVLHRRIHDLDRQIREMLRQQAELELDSSQRELEETQKAIQKLYEDVRHIREKAKQAEQTVQYITKDIKSLDTAKRNLTNSITVLKRLQMLCRSSVCNYVIALRSCQEIASAVDQLKTMVSRRQYKEVAQLLQATLELSTNFVTFKNIKQINDVLDQVQTIQTDLRRMIFSDFEGSFTQQGVFSGKAGPLSETCMVVDAMAPDVKKQLLEWYCDLQLREYRGIFRPTDEVGNLDNIARRYAWLKRNCKNYDEEQAGIFPTGWKVSEMVCERFCDITKDDLVQVLAKTPNLDVKLLIKSLQMTMEFEAGLNRRFATLQSVDQTKLLLGTSVSVNDIVSKQFMGKISICFDPYMRLYIEAEDKTLQEMLEKFRAKQGISEEDNQNNVFSASTDLFYFYRQTMVNLAKMTARKPFLDLSRLFSKYLVLFCDALQAKIPKDEKRPATTEEIKMVSFILNTAEYCQNTTTQLEEKIKEKIDDEFREQVNMDKERNAFLMLVTTSIQALVRLTNSCIYNALISMTKISWSSMQTVGDQSEYVTNIGINLQSNVAVARRHIINAKHFKWLCDKFVDSFVPWFMKNIYLCKPVSEIGAEQLLLDVHSIKTILLEMPNMGADEKVPVSAVYTKFVVKSISKAETLLKVVLTPLDPPEAIIKNFMILSSDGALDEMEKQLSVNPQKAIELKEGFIRVLELKGVKKSEQTVLIDLLIQRLAKHAPHPSLNTSGGSGPSASTTAPIGGGQPVTAAISTGMSSLASGLASISLNSSTNQATSSMKDAGQKFNENLKKLAAGSWLKRGDTQLSNAGTPLPPTTAQASSTPVPPPTNINTKK